MVRHCRPGLDGEVRRGMARIGNAGEAGQGPAPHGWERHIKTHTGERDRGINCAHFLQITTNQKENHD
jgi:hypothetical protein